MLYHAGSFAPKNHNDLMKIKFLLTQIDCMHTKGGLCVDSIFICNSNVEKGCRWFM